MNSKQDGQMEEVRRSSVMVEIRRVYEALQRFDLLAAEALGLNLTDLRCVNILKDGPLTPGAIAERLGLTSGSVTTMVDRLARRGAVSRVPDPVDRRSSSVCLDSGFRDHAASVFSQLGHELEASLAAAGFARSPATAALLDAMTQGIVRGGDRLIDISRSDSLVA